MTARCVVIGAGIIGSCISLRLSQDGADVTVVEANRPGSGATANSFAWVGASHPGLHEPEPYFLLNILGVQAYRRLAAEYDLGSWFNRCGCLTWSTDPGAQEATAKNAAFLADVGYNAVSLSRDYAVSILEPACAAPEATEAIAFFPDEGYVHGPPFVGRILAHARSAGATIAGGEQAVGFVTSGSRVTGVRLSSGKVLAADQVVVAAGRASPDLLAAAGFGFPLLPADTRASEVVGLLVISRPLATPIGRVLIADDIMIRPDGGGRIIIHDYRADVLVAADTPVIPLPEPAVELLRDVGRHVRGAGDAAVESARIGLRVLPKDGLPTVGRVPGHDNLYLCATHSGVTLAPLLAELAAAEILHDQDSSLLRTFRPARFA
jgi:D-hydroxyproline dehydrogenase subunit beta